MLPHLAYASQSFLNIMADICNLFSYRSLSIHPLQQLQAQRAEHIEKIRKPNLLRENNTMSEDHAKSSDKLDSKLKTALRARSSQQVGP